MVFKKGHKINIGRKMSKKSIEKAVKTKLEKYGFYPSNFALGYKLPKESREKMVKTKEKKYGKGYCPCAGYWKGKNHSKKTKEKLSLLNIKSGIGVYRKIAGVNKRSACCLCGGKKFLCVHHSDENRNNNKLSNLLVVCKKCHSRVHKKKRS